MIRIGRSAGTVLVALAVAFAAPWARAGGEDVARWKTVEIAVPPEDADEAVLGRPAALSLAADRIYIADSQDCAIKVFSKDGKFVRAFGRKGRGPGELSFPSGVAVAGDRVYVADKLNRRIQVFDPDGGFRGGFSLTVAPDKVFALASGALLVTTNPTGRGPGEKLLRLLDADGRPRWEGLEARVSADPVFDSFRNMILVCPGEEGGFIVVHRSGERTLLRFDGDGALLGEVPVDGRHAFTPMDIPFKGPVKRLLGFCWAAARDRGLLYLAAPEAVDGRDLGPGRRLSVVDGTGRLRAVVELARPVHRFAVDGDRIVAIDGEGALCLFEVVR